jgi:hypothetical protein
MHRISAGNITNTTKIRENIKNIDLNINIDRKNIETIFMKQTFVALDTFST